MRNITMYIVSSMMLCIKSLWTINTSFGGETKSSKHAPRLPVNSNLYCLNCLPMIFPSLEKTVNTLLFFSHIVGVKMILGELRLS